MNYHQIKQYEMAERELRSARDRLLKLSGQSDWELRRLARSLSLDLGELRGLTYLRLKSK